MYECKKMDFIARELVIWIIDKDGNRTSKLQSIWDDDIPVICADGEREVE